MSAEANEALFRRQARTALMAHGMPAADADVTIDLAVHASSIALQTFARTMNAIDGASWLNGSAIGLQLLSLRATDAQKYLIELADKEGIKSGSFTVDYTA